MIGKEWVAAGYRLEHPFLAVLETALLADRLIALTFTFALGLRLTFALAAATTTAAAPTPTASAATRPAAASAAAFAPLADRDYLDRAQEAVAGRAGR